MRVKRAALSILFAVAPFISNAQTAAPVPTDPGSRALLAQKAGRTSEAIELYREALRLKPAWTEGWWDLGRLLYQSRRWAEAREALHKVVSLEPRHVASWIVLGLCDYELKDYENALEHLQRARSFANFPNAQLQFAADYTTGLLLIHYGQFEAAGIVLFPLGSQAANDESYHLQMQRSGVSMPDLVAALGLVVLRLKIFPREIQEGQHAMIAEAGWAGLLMGQGEAAQARDAFLELETRYPKQPNVHYAVGICLEQSEPEAARAEFQKELEISSAHVAAMLNIAVIDHARGDDVSASSFAGRAVSLAPESYPARALYGRVLLELGQLKEAIRELEAAVRFVPEAKESHYALFRAYAADGRKADAAHAMAEFQRLEKLDASAPPSPERPK
jgi:tetratricopeptide (TPR) repeat protein